MSLKCFLNSNNFNTFPVNSNNIQEKKISSGYLASKMVQNLNHILKQVVLGEGNQHLIVVSGMSKLPFCLCQGNHL